MRASDLNSASDKTPGNVNVLLGRLVDAGVIYRIRKGDYAYTAPKFRDFRSAARRHSWIGAVNASARPSRFDRSGFQAERRRSRIVASERPAAAKTSMTVTATTGLREKKEWP